MSANSLRLHCFGGLWLEGPDGPLLGAASQRRRLAVLALIAASGPAGISRDRVLAYLWPDSDQDHARRALAQLTYSMRRAHGCALFAGEAELRLDDSLSSDVGEFLAAAASPETMAVLYAGPFLDGFHLTDAPEFGDWTARERDQLAGQAAAALERAAAAAESAGDTSSVTGHWRRRVNFSPLDPGPALSLMRALAAGGDRAGAIRHARIHQAMVRSELEMEPDPRIELLAVELRRAPGPSAAGKIPAAPTNEAATAAPREPRRRVADREPPAPSETPPRRHRAVLLGGLVLVAAVVAAVAWPRHPSPPLLAVGEVRFLAPERRGDADAFVDMLATSLARVEGMQVLSNSLMQEILAGLRHADPGATPARAAARLGAREVLEGTVRDLGSALQLDLRRVDLASGAVQRAYRVQGRDPFDLADAATAEVSAEFRLAAPPTAIASVTTRSLPAYRLYQAGLRAFNDGEYLQSYPLFSAAVAEDSTFPMAAYYAWRAALGASLSRELPVAYRRMLQVAGLGTERERLLIEGTIAALLMNVSAVAIAETLAIRYPGEPDAHLMLSRVRSAAGEFQGGLAEARLVRRMVQAHAGSDAVCRTCEAFGLEAGALIALDSLEAAELLVREWMAFAPQSLPARGMLADVLERLGRFAAADSVLVAGDTMGHPARVHDMRPIVYLIRAGRFAEADARLRASLLAAPLTAGSANWLLLISLRNQGRFNEALALVNAPGAVGLPPQALGHALFEVGRYAESARWFDSLATLPNGGSEGNEARSRTWALTHLATALAAERETTGLATTVEALRRSGLRSLYGRDRLLFHYAEALLLAARGDEDAAAAEFAAAISSPTEGFTRIQYQLARIRLRQRRPADAIAQLAPALRGSIDASNYYITRTELHELLAQAYDSAGDRGLAAVEYARVAAAWREADSGFAERGRSAGRRAVELR